MENTNRTVFGLGGIGGMLIATVLLLAILVVLTYWGITVQKDVMQKPYKIVDPSSIKMKSSPAQESKVMIIKE